MNLEINKPAWTGCRGLFRATSPGPAGGHKPALLRGLALPIPGLHAAYWGSGLPVPVLSAQCCTHSARCSVLPALVLGAAHPGAKCSGSPARCSVFGALCLVPSARCAGPCSWCLVSRARFPVPGTLCPVPGTPCPVACPQCRVPRARCPVPGAWCPVPCAWCPVPCARYPVPVLCARCPVPGTRRSLRGRLRCSATSWPAGAAVCGPGAARLPGCFRTGGFGGARGGGAGRPGAVWALHRGKMADREEALREFVAVTGAEEERARFFLESAGWDLQVPLPLPSLARRGDRRGRGSGGRGAGGGQRWAGGRCPAGSGLAPVRRRAQPWRRGRGLAETAAPPGSVLHFVARGEGR